MNVLVACEESQAVCKAFRKLGHVAYSCDIQECSGGHPEWHINGDVLPWMFGHPVQKKTCLWLKGLNNLQPTDVTKERQSSKVAGNWFNHGGKDRQKNRAKTFPEIAKAMAEQWGGNELE